MKTVYQLNANKLAEDQEKLNREKEELIKKMKSDGFYLDENNQVKEIKPVYAMDYGVEVLQKYVNEYGFLSIVYEGRKQLTEKQMWLFEKYIIRLKGIIVEEQLHEMTVVEEQEVLEEFGIKDENNDLLDGRIGGFYEGETELEKQKTYYQTLIGRMMVAVMTKGTDDYIPLEMLDSVFDSEAEFQKNSEFMLSDYECMTEAEDEDGITKYSHVKFMKTDLSDKLLGYSKVEDSMYEV